MVTCIFLQTMAKNKKYNKRIINNERAYKKYDNYDAIEVPFLKAIPVDYKGVMGVPITFFDEAVWGLYFDVVREDKVIRPKLNGKTLYARVFIKWKTEEEINRSLKSVGLYF